MVDAALPVNRESSPAPRGPENPGSPKGKPAGAPPAPVESPARKAGVTPGGVSSSTIRVREAERDPAERGPALPEPTPEEVHSRVQEINDRLGQNTRLNFHVNEETGKMVVQIIDKETQEIIKTIPPSDLDEVSKRLPHGSVFLDSTS